MKLFWIYQAWKALLVTGALLGCDIDLNADIHDNEVVFKPDVCAILNPALDACSDTPQDQSYGVPRYEGEPCLDQPCAADLVCACGLCFDIADLGL